jgi:hypothetical protein
MLPNAALAITAKDVLEKMTDKERFGYVTGLVDMHSYQSLVGGDRKRAECISDAFYKGDAITKKIFEAFSRFPDKSPEGIVILLFRQSCGG